MNLGFFMMPLHPPAKSRTQCFDEDIELAVLAEDYGFTEGWIGQHLSNSWEPIPSNDLFIAHALARTRSIRLGGAVTLVPQHHPVNVAPAPGLSGSPVPRAAELCLRSRRDTQ